MSKSLKYSALEPSSYDVISDNEFETDAQPPVVDPPEKDKPKKSRMNWVQWLVIIITVVATLAVAGFFIWKSYRKTNPARWSSVADSSISFFNEISDQRGCEGKIVPTRVYDEINKFNFTPDLKNALHHVVDVFGDVAETKRGRGCSLKHLPSIDQLDKLVTEYSKAIGPTRNADDFKSLLTKFFYDAIHVTIAVRDHDVSKAHMERENLKSDTIKLSEFLIGF